ncbi:MAG: energy transducer TonB [Chromatiaceae bacterium]|nr:energy transducer TonB [Chromatiaceae bacterium]MCP5408101.1 energy transducer TonB [Chromatiaceae bacterium]MCP5443000.1 energy transducer TonB [Chromatiaceae bacterium]
MRKGDEVSATDRFGLTLFVALVLHAMVILGVSFNFEKPTKQPSPDRTLEIMVVRNPAAPEKPEQADFLAQVSQQGGGSEEEISKPSTQINPPAPRKAEQVSPLIQPSQAPDEPAAPVPREVLNRPTPAKKSVVIAERKKPVEITPKKVTAAQLLASTSREIDRLTAELDRKNLARSKWQRHKKLTASTREYKYASYLDAWVKKVERIGNLNYPDEARRNKLFGNLILHVALLADGSVKEINVKKSSGYKLLDDAAVRIVRLSAPFAPFPSNIREETDVIDIIRTWQFRNNNQLSSK